MTEPIASPAAKESLDPSWKALNRPAAVEAVVNKPRHPRQPCLPAKADAASFQRNDRTRADGFGGLNFAQLAIDPFVLAHRPLQGRVAACSFGETEDQPLPRLVKAEAHGLGARMG